MLHPNTPAALSQSNDTESIDAKLVDRFKNGDMSAFDEIALKFRDDLFVVSFSILHDTGDAEGDAS